MVKQVEQENKKLERAPAQSLTDNTMRNTMRKALHASTYERFRHRTLNDSDEELAGTLKCGIDHTVGLFRRFALFHPCFDQKVYRVVYSSHLDSCVV